VSGILYDSVLFNNMNDGLMFHTCWNTPIEWATARTSFQFSTAMDGGGYNGSAI